MRNKISFFNTYFFSLILITSIALGGIFGYFFGNNMSWLKPFGTLFINLVLTCMVPLIFFSVSSAITKMNSLNKLGKIIFYMASVFAVTGIIASISSLLVVKIFPPTQNINLHLTNFSEINNQNLFTKIISIFSVPNFAELLSHQNMLALIIFSILIGLAVSLSQEKGKPFANLLQSGEIIFMKVFTLIMYYAPIGFFAYFAVLVSELGPQIFENYLRIALIYYIFSIVYFIGVFTFYAYLAGQLTGIRLFWKNLFLPAITSIATCSSAVSIPANLIATQKMHIPDEIRETVIPLGAILHKQGSIIGGMIKIAFLFSIYNINFSGFLVLTIAVSVSLLVGTVMGAIPSGGMLGELFILTVYGFPPSILVALAAISIIIDPMATLLNVTGNTANSMIITRFVEGKNWLIPKKQ